MAVISLPSCTVAPTPAASSARAWQQQHPTWLYAGLLAGTVADRTSTSHKRHEVAVDVLGSVPLPDGRLVACDPYVGGAGAAPFRTLMPLGEHPAYLARTRIANDHWRVLAAVLATGSGPVASWAMGRVGHEGLPDGSREYTGFGVDAGTGCLASPLAMPDVAEVLEADEGMLEDPLSVALFESDLDAGVAAPRPGALPVAVFNSGWGDGVYPTWLGLAPDGSVAVAMVDLMVLNDPFVSPADEPEVTATPAGRGGFWTARSGGADTWAGEGSMTHDGPMRRPMLIAIGVLLVLVGALWTLQGLGYVGGSVMSGKTTWAVIGPIVVIVGAVLGWRGLGRRGADSGPA